MKTFAALGLLLFSGVLVVSGAMMGTLGAEQDVDSSAGPRPGPCEIRVYLQGPDGQAWSRGRITNPSVLVEPVTRTRPGDRVPEESAPPAPGERLSRQVDLEWVAPAGGRAREAEKTLLRGEERRSDAGYVARVVVLEPKDAEEARRAAADEGGYWRALYTPPADRHVVGFATTVLFKDRGETRTIGGFVHPPVDAADRQNDVK